MEWAKSGNRSLLLGCNGINISFRREEARHLSASFHTRHHLMSLTNTLTDRSAGNVMPSEAKLQIGVFLAYGLGAVLAGVLVGPALSVVAWIPTLAVPTALGCCAAAAKGSLR